MDSVRRNISIIEHILRYCEEIAEMVARFGDSLNTFQDDFAFKHACTMCIIQIGELTIHLTDDFKHEYDGVPWKNIKFLRNLAAHNYGKMSVSQLWNTVKQDIPMLSTYCLSILAEHGGKGSDKA